MKTYSLKPKDITKKWWVVDAEGLTLGRMAAKIATYLMGKHKPTYTPHMDGGDYVVVVNAEKVALSKGKLDNKRFYWHTGYPGGIKSRTMRERLEGAHPERVVQKAVERMMTKTPLRDQRMKNLKIYKGQAHKHEAQSPEKLDIGSMNPKNTRIGQRG